MLSFISIRSNSTSHGGGSDAHGGGSDAAQSSPFNLSLGNESDALGIRR